MVRYQRFYYSLSHLQTLIFYSNTYSKEKSDEEEEEEEEVEELDEEKKFKDCCFY